jgi:hypothetical protein
MLDLEIDKRPDLSDVVKYIDEELDKIESGSGCDSTAPKDKNEPQIIKVTPKASIDDSDPYDKIEQSYLNSDPNIIKAEVNRDCPSIIKLTYKNGSRIKKKINI